MKPGPTAVWSVGLVLLSAAFASQAAAHSRRVAHGPTSPSFFAVAPADGVSPRLILRHLTSDGAAVEADPVTVADARSGERFAEHLHGAPLLSRGMTLRTELVVDAPTVCEPSTSAASRYRLRDLANALRHTFTPGERVAITLLESGRDPVRLEPTDTPDGALAWLTSACAARQDQAAHPAFDSDGLKRLREGAHVEGKEQVVWVLVFAGAAARLQPSAATLLSGIRLGLLESFVPSEPVPALTPPAQRQPGTYQTDPIVAHLRSSGVIASPPPGSAWTQLCDAVRTTAGSCLLGALIPGANAMASQRLLAEAQALFVTPISCLPENTNELLISTETGKATVSATELAAARCGGAPPSDPDSRGAVLALLSTCAITALAAALRLAWRRRRQAGSST